MKKLIDISQHNGNINFEELKNNGIKNVIIRVGWIGNKQNHTLDTKFEENYKKAKENGFKVGFYVYSYCKSVETLRQGVNWLLEKIDTKQNEIGVFLDLEDETIQEIGRQNLTDQAKQFCEIIKNSGYIAGIYANKYWFEHLLDIKQLLNYKIWLAEWNKKDNYSVTFRVDIWQYGQTEIKGINGQVDINNIYYSVIKKEKSIDEIAYEIINDKNNQKWGTTYTNPTRKQRLENAGYNYQEVQNKVNEILKAKNNEIIYIVKKGDCLCNIAKKFNTTVNKIAIDNGITNVDFIYAGQKLIIRR